MDTKIADTVNASQDAIVARDPDRYVSFLAEDVVLNEPATPPLVGREACRKFVEGLLALCSEITFLDRKVFPVGKSAAMRFTLRLRTASGKETTLEGVDVFEVNDEGLIQTCSSYSDPSSIASLMEG